MPGDADRLQQLLAVAYAYLNRRERTVDEVRRRLAKEGPDEALVEEALASLVADGFLDDARFARLFVEDKRHLEQWGSERIRRGLLDRGIEPDLIEQTLDEGEASDIERAMAILTRRFPSPPSDRRGRDRALGVLIRKGYDPELALDALAAYSRIE